MATYRPGDRTFINGIHPRSFSSNISRTDTSAADLYALPPKSRIKQITILGPKSDAGTSARISLTSNGGAAGALLAHFNVKANGGVSYPSSFDPDWAINDPNPTIVTAVYAEDGAGASVGGPWSIVIDTL